MKRYIVILIAFVLASICVAGILPAIRGRAVGLHTIFNVGGQCPPYLEKEYLVKKEHLKQQKRKKISNVRYAIT